MKASRPDGLLFPCKAADLKWPTIKAIVLNRIAHHSMSEHDLEQLKKKLHLTIHGYRPANVAVLGRSQCWIKRRYADPFG